MSVQANSLRVSQRSLFILTVQTKTVKQDFFTVDQRNLFILTVQTKTVKQDFLLLAKETFLS